VAYGARLDQKGRKAVDESVVMTAAEVEAMKRAPAVDGVLPVFRERWSALSFADRKVSDADLMKVFEAARWTASAINEQPWRFLVGHKGHPTWKKIFNTLSGMNSQWASKAPVLILGVAHTRFSGNGQENPWALFDLGAATYCLTLEAAALKMTTHQMAAYDHKAARKALGIPAEYALGTVVALGYHGEPAALEDEALIERETTARTRKPLRQMVFTSWGEPAKLEGQ